MTRATKAPPPKRMAWARFSWGDHERDIGLSLCSPGAQGLWMRMQCAMASSEVVGVLVSDDVPMDVAAIARRVGWSRRTVAPLLRELERNGVFSRNERGAIYSRRMVHDYSTHLKMSAAGKKGGNPAITPPPVPARDGDDATVRGPVAVQSRSSRGPMDRHSKAASANEIGKNKSLAEKKVKLELNAESESESDKKETPAESPNNPAPMEADNVVGLRPGQPPPVPPSPPVQPHLKLGPLPVRLPRERKAPTGAVMRKGFEQAAPKGDPVTLADAQTALDAWNALAVVLGMHQAGMSKERRKRIAAILREFGGLPAWRLALVKVEESGYWSGRSGHPYRPTIMAFTDPEKFRTLLEGGYADRRPVARDRFRGGAARGPDRPGPLDEVFDKYAAAGGKGP